MFSLPLAPIRSLSLGRCLMFGLGGLLVLSGCTTTVTQPARPTSTQRVAGISVDEGLAYLDRARTNMEDAHKMASQIDDATKLGVGVGVGGAALATLAHAHADVVLGSLIVGGTSYAVSQSTAPLTRIDILNAGLRNLTCLEESGLKVHRETGGARARLAPIRDTLSDDLARLRASLAKADDPANAGKVTADIRASAQAALVSGVDLLAAINRFIAATEVGTALYVGTSRTVDEVNAQLRAKSPDITQIAKAGTVITDFVAARTTELNAQADATSKQAGQKVGVTQSENELLVEISTHLNRLRDTIALAQATLPPQGFAEAAQLSQCQTVIPGASPLLLGPAAPVTLEPGGAPYHLWVKGDLPFTVRWSGAVPPETQLASPSKLGERTIQLSAPVGAKAGTYRVFVSRESKDGKEDRTSNEVEVQVKAADAKNPNVTEVRKEVKKETKAATPAKPVPSQPGASAAGSPAKPASSPIPASPQLK